ncbi:MAG: glycosyltransferase [Desulfovibrionaceae bacterium]
MNAAPSTLAIIHNRPLRIMQVHALYPTYVDWYYEHFPNVALADHATQTLALKRHGLHAMYILTDELQALGCETTLVYANAIPLQRAWAHEHGYPIDHLNTAQLRHSVLAAQIEAYKPDVLYFSDNHYFDGSFVRSLAFRPPLVIGWRHAPVALDTDWHGFDIILTLLHRIAILAPYLGAKHAELFCHGYPQWIANKIDKIDHDTDIVFCGTYQTPFAPACHNRRRECLNAIIQQAIARQHSLRLSVCDGKECVPPYARKFLVPPCYGVDMLKETRRGRISLDMQGWVNANLSNIPILRLTGADTTTMRLFESVGGGSLTFTEERAGLQRFFTPGVELETYTTVQELKDKITYYLENPQERERIALQGMRRCREEYSQAKGAIRFLEIIHQYMSTKTSSTPASATLYTDSLPAKSIEKMLKIFLSCPAEGNVDIDIIEQHLFKSICKLATSGDIKNAMLIDQVMTESPYIQKQLGGILSPR